MRLPILAFMISVGLFAKAAFAPPFTPRVRMVAG